MKTKWMRRIVIVVLSIMLLLVNIPFKETGIAYAISNKVVESGAVTELNSNSTVSFSVGLYPGESYDFVAEFVGPSSISFSSTNPTLSVYSQNENVARLYIGQWSSSGSSSGSTIKMNMSIHAISSGLTAVEIVNNETGEKYYSISVMVYTPEVKNINICENQSYGFNVKYESSAPGASPLYAVSEGNDKCTVENITKVSRSGGSEGIFLHYSSYAHNDIVTMNFKEPGTYNLYFYDPDKHYVAGYSVNVCEHEYVRIVTKEATCVHKMEVLYTCGKCGYSYKAEEGELTDHYWDTTFTIDKEATCVGEGIKSKHCLNEGCNATTEIEIIPSTGIHAWNEEYTIDKSATCTEEGSKSIHCSVCDAIDEATVTVIPMTEHAYGDWTVIKDATCTETGSKEKICADCGDKVTEVIPAKGHIWNEEYTVDKEATCTEEGSKSIHCSVCDAIDEATVTATPKIDHTWNEGIITKEPTYDEKGETTYICAFCGETYTEEIPVLIRIGWQKIDSKWYYYLDGTATTGWQKISSKWYYFNTSGVMQTGWVKLNGKWYYFNSSGAMLTGWQKIGSKQYFFKPSGVMAANEWVKGYYWINKDGTWTYKYKASWKKSGSKWWFTDTSGWYAKNTTITIDGKKYTFDKSGWLVS